MTENVHDDAKKRRQRRGKKRRSGAEESATQPEPSINAANINAEISEQPNTAQDEFTDFQLESMPIVENFGHFGRVNEETMAYFRQIEPMLSQEALSEKDPEERQLFLQNIYSEVDGNEINLATEYTCSRIMEKLIRVSEPFHYRVFLDRMRGQFFNLFTNRFASHVMQTLLSLSASAFEEDEQSGAVHGSEGSGTLLPLKTLFINMCTELESHWSTLMVDTYGSHILRLLLNILSGNRLMASENANLIRSKASKKYHEAHSIDSKEEDILKKDIQDVPPEFKIILAKVAENLVKDLSEIEIRTLSSHAVASPVFQSILILHQDDPQVLRNIINQLLLGIDSKQKNTAHPADEIIKNLLHSQIGSHLLERIVACAPPDLLEIIFENYFLGQMLPLAMDSISNYVLQQTIEQLPTGKLVNQAIAELAPAMKQLLFRGRVNVVHKLIDVTMKQKADLTMLRKSITLAFIDNKNEDQKRLVIELILRLQSFDDYQRQQRPYQFAGAKLIQQLLSFPNDHNIFLISSFLSMSIPDRLAWTSDKIASRVIEAFLASPNVGDKVKRKIIRGFEGHFGDLSKDKYASHLVDKCWAACDMKQKISIAEELVEHEKELAPSFHGRFILRNCRIDQFKRRREDWIAKEEGARKKMKLFSEILSGVDIQS